MGIQAIYFGDGKTVNGILHVSTTDAIFRTLDGKPIAMEFHHYCGPSFFLKDDTSDWIPEIDSDEWHNLWQQFYGWWDAKGKAIYQKQNPETLDESQGETTTRRD